MSTEPKRRKDLPRAARLDVLMEAGYMCGNPRCRHILTLELHHIVWVADGGGDDASNLIALCPNCHALHTNGHIPQGAIRHWKGMLLALNHAFDRDSMNLLLLLNKSGTLNGLSADSAPSFAGLVAAGLAYWGFSSGGNCGYGEQWNYRAGLTQEGQALVDAWLAGDEDKYLAMISGQ